MKEKNEQPALWTGSFIRICLVNLFIFVNFHALLPTFPFFVTYLGGDAVTIGLATALFSIASIVSRPFVGWLVDTKGRCTLLLIGLVGMASIPMGYFVSAGISLAILLRTVHGVFHAASAHLPSGGIYFIFIALATVATRVLLGRAIDRYGEARLVYSGNAAIIAGILLLVFATTLPVTCSQPSC